jgi:hypothetical protein
MAAASALMTAGTMAGVSVITAGAANAASSNSGSLPVTANITSNGTGPNIECSWLVTDNNHNGGAETSNTNTSAHDYTGTPYTSTPGATAPTPPGGTTTANGQSTAINYSGTADGVNTGPAPCQLPGTPNNNLPNPGAPQEPTSPFGSGVSVLPNAFNANNGTWANDGNAQRRVELWSAVDDVNGVSYVQDVYWDVYYPDGKLKVELFSAAPIEGSSACTGSLYTSLLAPMFNQAIADGELSSAAVNDQTNGMITLCNEDVKSLWHNAFDISKDDPNGTYTVTTNAIDQNGVDSQQSFTFKVIPFIAFAQDFSSVNWGNVTPGGSKTVAGDTNFQPPNSTAPTVTNGGNEGMQVGVQFFPLTGATHGKVIGTPDSTGNGYFDASFGYNASYLQSISPIAPASGSPGSSNTDQVKWFNGSGPQLVCPDDTPKLDLSVHPQMGIPVDTYSGSMVVWSQPSPGLGTVSGTAGYCPTDNGAPYTPVTADAGAPVRLAPAGT